MVLPLPHGMIWVVEGVVAHMPGGEVFPGQVCDSVTQLVVMSGSEETLLKIKGM